MEAFGKHLVIEPYLATVVLGGGLIAALGSTAERQAMLPAVMEGEFHLAFAHEERDVPTRAQRTNDGYSLREERRSSLAARARTPC